MLSAAPFPAAQRRAFFAVIAAQFFSSLADNALLIAAIGLLMERHAAAWMTPTLRLLFYLSFVLLAVFAGAVTDALPKGRVIFITNLVKLGGCGLLLVQVHPLLAYALIGLGAAAYSPAKYGILPELLPPTELVKANAWMEVSTLFSILLGVWLGSVLLGATSMLSQLGNTPATHAIALIGVVYFIAVLCAAAIPKHAASNTVALAHPRALVRNFYGAFKVLWHDPEGQISLAVTSLFWAVAAALQFIILRWAAHALQLPLAQAALLQVAVALGMAAGAVAAARWVPMRHALTVLPIGLVIGLTLLLLTWVSQVWVAIALLFAMGALSGLLLVPMNALLQSRGQLLMHSGQSVAVQNFNESLASLVLLAVYGGLLYVNAPLLPTIVGLGVLVVVAMLVFMFRHSMNRDQRRTVGLDALGTTQRVTS